MLRTPDGIIEKVALKDVVMDCAPYMSVSRLTFSGCFLSRRGDLEQVRGLYKVGEPLFTFESRGKITRDYDGMVDLINRFAREFNITNALIYYDNFAVRIYDYYKKAILLEDTPVFVQGHLFIYRLNLPFKLDTTKTTTNEKILNHIIEFTGNVNTFSEFEEDFHLSPGYGFVLQNVEDTVARISSPDHGEEEITLPAGIYLFVHSPLRRGND